MSTVDSLDFEPRPDSVSIDVSRTDDSIKLGMQHVESIVDVADFHYQEEKKDAENDTELVPAPFLLGCDSDVVNITSASMGARILFATDEWFAAADNLLKDTPPHFDPSEYCEQGKVMDGWETRRRREAGHDWCLIRLPERVHNIVGIEVDTAHFTGNNAPAVSIEIADIPSCVKEVELVAKLPNALQRLLHGCVQGTGNSPSQVAAAEKTCRENAVWNTLLPKTPLSPGYERSRMHYFTVSDQNIAGTHLRLNYFPDGGVARIRVWGKVSKDSPTPVAEPAYSPITTGERCTVASHGSVPVMPSQESYEFAEISSLENGGMGLICSNKHYGEPYYLLQSSLGRDMGDGWETARHPDRPHVLVKNPVTGLVESQLSDWCILKLGQAAVDGVARVILDTKHFRGNYPESVQVEGCYCPNDDSFWGDEYANGVQWFPLVDRVRMAPDSEHVFERSKDQLMNALSPVTHIRVTTFPDGGISRVRVYDVFEDAGDKGGVTSEEKVHVRVQQRNGRKCITTVAGLADDLDIKRICKLFKKNFPCNGAVQKGEEVGEVIQLSGDQRTNVKSFLVDQEICHSEKNVLHDF